MRRPLRENERGAADLRSDMPHRARAWAGLVATEGRKSRGLPDRLCRLTCYRTGGTRKNEQPKQIEAAASFTTTISARDAHSTLLFGMRELSLIWLRLRGSGSYALRKVAVSISDHRSLAPPSSAAGAAVTLRHSAPCPSAQQRWRPPQSDGSRHLPRWRPATPRGPHPSYGASADCRGTGNRYKRIWVARDNHADAARRGNPDGSYAARSAGSV